MRRRAVRGASESQREAVATGRAPKLVRTRLKAARRSACVVAPPQRHPSTSSGITALAKQLQRTLPHLRHVVGGEQSLDGVLPEPMNAETAIVLDAEQRHLRDETIEVAIVAGDAVHILGRRAPQRRDREQQRLVTWRERGDDLLPQELGRGVRFGAESASRTSDGQPARPSTSTTSRPWRSANVVDLARSVNAKRAGIDLDERSRRRDSRASGTVNGSRLARTRCACGGKLRTSSRQQLGGEDDAGRSSWRSSRIRHTSSGARSPNAVSTKSAGERRPRGDAPPSSRSRSRERDEARPRHPVHTTPTASMPRGSTWLARIDWPRSVLLPKPAPGDDRRHRARRTGASAPRSTEGAPARPISGSGGAGARRAATAQSFSVTAETLGPGPPRPG